MQSNKILNAFKSDAFALAACNRVIDKDFVRYTADFLF